MIKKGVLRGIVFYRKYLSHYSKGCCRFVPTCSEYSYESIVKHGVLKGGILTVKRVFKCNPFHKGGYDPVP